MGPENGGLVLDVSDGGLSFHSVAPVQTAETIHFLLSMRGQTRIEGAGEVVWTNELRTVCGLKFISLSGDAREFLNTWTNKSQQPLDAREDTFLSPTTATSQAEGALPSFASQSDASTETLFAIPPLREVFSPESAGRSLWREPICSWIMFGILAAALALTAYNYGVHVGKSEFSSAAQSSANPTPQESPPLPPPVLVTAPSVAGDVPSLPNAQPSGPKIEESAGKDALVNASKTNDATATTLQGRSADLPDATASDPRAEQSSEASKSQLAAALAYLNGQNASANSSKAVKLLWAAVGNGNSDAEVILAGLYASGDGVAKNCEQGRVLLQAAVKSGNARAKVKLAELNMHGCP
jgi:TPR repeat protein